MQIFKFWTKRSKKYLTVPNYLQQFINIYKMFKKLFNIKLTHTDIQAIGAKYHLELVIFSSKYKFYFFTNSNISIIKYSNKYLNTFLVFQIHFEYF